MHWSDHPPFRRCCDQLQTPPKIVKLCKQRQKSCQTKFCASTDQEGMSRKAKKMLIHMYVRRCARSAWARPSESVILCTHRMFRLRKGLSDSFSVRVGPLGKIGKDIWTAGGKVIKRGPEICARSLIYTERRKNVAKSQPDFGTDWSHMSGWG